MSGHAAPRGSRIAVKPGEGVFAQLEGVQKAVGHRDPSKTKAYDCRSHNPKGAPRFSRRIDLQFEE
jgi:hypothetical protein